MNFQALALKAGKQAEFFLKKNGPTILTGAGVAGFVATTAFTIRATARAVDALPSISKRVQNARDKALLEEMNSKDASTELAKAYVTNAGELIKIYTPTLVLGSTSIICVVAAHGIMLKRQANLVAVYAALDASYKAYRSRVAEKIGAEEERHLYRGPSLRALDQIEGEEGDPGSEIDMNDVMPSPYARFFDETSRNWTKTPEYNLMFLRAQQDWANDRLRAHGFIFLNEIYEALGLERSQAGQSVGWKLNGKGDGFVDFGIYDIADECNRAFVNGIEHTVLLDFNVDGPINI